MAGEKSRVLTSGIVLAGTFPGANPAFDRLSPRPLVPVTHRPLIAYSLTWLQSVGMQDAVICGNRNSRALQARVMRHSSGDLDLTYLEDQMPRGAAGCILDASMFSDSQTFVVTDGAAIPNVDLDDLLDAHAASGAAMTIVVHHEPRGIGQSPLQVPAGIYVLDRRALDPIARQGFVDIKEHLIPSLVRAGEHITTFLADGAMPRVLDGETYLAVNEFATHRLSTGGLPPVGFELRGEAFIHRDAVVGEDVTMVGPIIVSAGTTIEPGAVIIGPTSIGLDVTIGARALVSRSSVWRRARIQSNASVDRSIVADDGVVGSDRRAYRTIVGGTPRRRLAAVLGLPVGDDDRVNGTNGNRRRSANGGR